MLVVGRGRQHGRARYVKPTSLDGVAFAHVTQIVHELERRAVANGELLGIDCPQPSSSSSGSRSEVALM